MTGHNVHLLKDKNLNDEAYLSFNFLIKFCDECPSISVGVDHCFLQFFTPFPHKRFTY